MEVNESIKSGNVSALKEIERRIECLTKEFSGLIADMEKRLNETIPFPNDGNTINKVPGDPGCTIARLNNKIDDLCSLRERLSNNIDHLSSIL